MRVERHRGVDALAPGWDDLADRLGAAPWLRPGWFSAWIDAFADADTIEILAVRAGDALAGVLPLLRGRRSVRSPTNWHTPEFGILAEPDAARVLSDELLAERPRTIALGWIGGDTLATVRAAARRAGYRTHERPVMRSPFLPLDAQVASPRRASTGRHLRQLERSGDVRLDVQHGVGRLGEGFRVEASGWKREEGTAIVSRPETQRFYETVARWAAGRGLLRLFFLRLDERPIAFVLGLEDCGRLFYVKGGYDEEFRRFGPGVILAHAMVEHARERGLRTFEFLGDAEPWKREWTDHVRELHVLRAFAPSPVAQAERAFYAYVQPAARGVRERLHG